MPGRPSASKRCQAACCYSGTPQRVSSAGCAESCEHLSVTNGHTEEGHTEEETTAPDISGHGRAANGYTEEETAASDVSGDGDGYAAPCDGPPPEDVSASAFDLGFSRDGHSDPRVDVVLRIEADTEASTKVTVRLRDVVHLLLSCNVQLRLAECGRLGCRLRGSHLRDTYSDHIANLVFYYSKIAWPARAAGHAAAAHGPVLGTGRHHHRADPEAGQGQSRLVSASRMGRFGWAAGRTAKLPSIF